MGQINSTTTARASLVALVTAAMLAVLAFAASPAFAEFGIAPGARVELSSTQAGAHPDLTTSFELSDEDEDGEPDRFARDVRVALPPGFWGTPTYFESCTEFQVNLETCPNAAKVGEMNVHFVAYGYGFAFWAPAPIYNVRHGDDLSAEFAAKNFAFNATMAVSVRSADYGLETASLSIQETGLAVAGAQVTLWGVPGDHYGSEVARRPLLTNPASCETPLSGTISAYPWGLPAEWKSQTLPVVLAGAPADAPATALTGCDLLPRMNPELVAGPGGKAAASPSGYDIDLKVPQSGDPDAITPPTVKNVSLRLPEGVAISPAAADGLGTCTDAQLAAGTDIAPSCPGSSKVGSVSIDTPALADPLKGSLYLGEPQAGNRYRLFLVAKGPGVMIKLRGEAHPDPETGQLTSTFSDTPPLPFSQLHVHLKGGERALLATPAGCGSYTTAATLTPYGGGADEVAESTFEINEGCQSSSFAPGFKAGSVNPLAGTASPFIARITRKANEPALDRIDVSPPVGVLARLQGVPYCPEAALQAAASRSGAAEQSAPSCPATSEVGSVQVGAGPGNSPFYVPGKVYLAGPYKGAPLSLATVVPALAGPYDLGTVVVRSAVSIDPVDTHVSVDSDPLPQILEGIPLQVRDVRFSLDRPQFTVNPTGCGEKEVSGEITSASGDSTAVSNRYQLGDCAALGFKPKLSMSFSGPTHRSAHPALRAVVKARKGDANIGRAVVTLPKTEFLENAHIRTICTRVQYAADNCPKGSIYGYAKAWSPLLDKPLQGPVYLRSSNHPLPDLVASLDGQIHIDLAGRIDSVHSRMRATFDSVPDAPVSKFVLDMQGGSKGLLVNNTELCQAKPRASVEFTGHNGKRSSSNPLVKVDCGGRSAQRHRR